MKNTLVVNLMGGPGVAESVDLMIKDIVEYLDKFGGNK